LRGNQENRQSFTDSLIELLSIMQTLVGQISLVNTKVSFLEMHSKPNLVNELPSGVQFRKLSGFVDSVLYRKFYYGVGKDWHWLDRMVMPDVELETAINASNTEIWILQVEGNDAGFAEFVKGKEFIEILYFGLLPDYIGQGLGKFFLQWVIDKAWSFQPKWIQLNTCELDHPNALPVYLKSGFRLVREEMQERRVLKE
jgi:GNAT superfamily N-acetyltransferase